MPKVVVDRKNPTQTEIAPLSEAPVENRILSHSDIFLRLCMISLLAFVAGYILTVVATSAVGYVDLPNSGEIRKNANGIEYFYPYYTDFYRFALPTDDSPFRQTDSYFKRVGLLGTSLYIYGISNALHWIMEMKIQNFQAILLIPWLVLLGALFVFLKFSLPLQYQTSDRVMGYAVSISLLHGTVLIIFLALSGVISDNFRALYDNQFLYVGQILGIAIPSMFIILCTSLFYGTVIGGVAYFFMSTKEALDQSRYPKRIQS